MIKVLIFDDEYIVLEGLSEMVDWHSYGLDLAGMALDGPSALELFHRESPDIIMTDILMPGMDGLQLIKSVLNVAPDTYCIVFSGHNEYEYVKRAIQLGVSDYLEKPMEVESIEQALQKAIAHIGKRDESQTIKRNYEKSKSVMLEKATLELLFGSSQAFPKWKEHFGPQADLLAGVTVLACSDRLSIDHRPDCHIVQLRNGDEHLMVLLHRFLPAHELWEELDQEIEKQNITVGSGRTKLELVQMAESYRESQRALRSARFMHQRGRVGFDDLGDLITNPDPLSEREEAVILSLRTGNYAGLMEQIDPFLDWIQTEMVAPEVVEREMVKLLYLALEAAKESAVPNRKEQFSPHVEIRNLHGRDQMIRWFRERFEHIVKSALELRENTKYATVEQARFYIEKHLSQDLSLQEVARHVGMNPSYLSLLFKEVTGETYIKYLTRYRMELAKKLLTDGFKVSEVSERVGYHTYRHFSEVFKKYTGMAPGQFKEKFDMLTDAVSLKKTDINQ